MKAILLLLLTCVFALSACSGATPAATQPILPSATSVPAASPEPIANGVGYYYFVPANSAIPQGSVVIMPDTYILAPTRLDVPFSADAAADVKVALQAALSDTRNQWTGNKLEIVQVTFDAGLADVIMQGEYFGLGDVTLIAARTQILLTVFANPAVQSARITCNGDTIGNWGVSISLNAKPVDYVFTRAEIEAFIAGNLHDTSASPVDAQPSSLVFPHVSGDAGNFYLMAGETIAITWENAPMGADRYEFVLAPQNQEPPIVLGNDTDASDGVAISWIIPEQVAAELQATAYFSDGRQSKVSFAPMVYSGEIPPAGVCSLIARNQPIEVYRLPDRTAEIFALLYPAVYAHVLEVTPDGWYRIDASVAKSSDSSAVSGDGWVNGDKGILLVGACPPGQP